MIDSTTREHLKNKIKTTQEELVRLSFSKEKDPARHESLLRSLNDARNQLSRGLYGIQS